MQPTRTFEEILAGKPDCFAIPHEFTPGLKRCESCAVRQDCLDTSAQMFSALRIGLIKGKTIASIEYGPDATPIIPVIMRSSPNRSALHPCKHTALPKLFERAMHAYANRPPELSVDDLIADLDAPLDQSESQGEIRVMSATTHEAVNAPNCGEIEDLDDMPIEPGAKAQAKQLIEKLTNSAEAVIPTMNEEASPGVSIVPVAASTCQDTSVPTCAEDPFAGAATSTSRSESGSRTVTVSPVAGIVSKSSYSLAGAARLDSYRTVDDKSLIKALREIYDRVKNHGVDYHDVREDYCAINRVLNERQLISPGFRPYLPVPHTSKKYADVPALLANDRRMFDIEWLHRLGYPNELDDPAFADLLCADELDYDLAAGFVTKDWTTVKRIEMLALSPAEQRPLGMFVSNEVRKLLDDARKESRKIRVSLKARMAREKKLLPYVDDYVQLWIATQVCAGEPHSSIGQMYGWLKGEKPPAASTLSSKLKTLNRLLGS